MALAKETIGNWTKYKIYPADIRALGAHAGGSILLTTLKQGHFVEYAGFFHVEPFEANPEPEVFTRLNLRVFSSGLQGNIYFDRDLFPTSKGDNAYEFRVMTSPMEFISIGGTDVHARFEIEGATLDQVTAGVIWIYLRVEEVPT